MHGSRNRTHIHQEGRVSNNSWKEVRRTSHVCFGESAVSKKRRETKLSSETWLFVVVLLTFGTGGYLVFTFCCKCLEVTITRTEASLDRNRKVLKKWILFVPGCEMSALSMQTLLHKGTQTSFICTLYIERRITDWEYATLMKNNHGLIIANILFVARVINMFLALGPPQINSLTIFVVNTVMVNMVIALSL